MVWYDYKCDKCNFKMEVRCSITSDHEQCCLVCMEPMNKVISASPVHFKGTGFYETDYKGK